MRRIVPRADSRFTLAEDGQGIEAMVLGVRDFHECYDAVSYHPEDPANWWLAFGTAEVLGERAIRHAAFENRPLLLVETPAKWLTLVGPDGPEASCIVDWRCDPRLILPFVSEIECESSALRDRLLKSIAQHARPPFKISVSRHAA